MTAETVTPVSRARGGLRLGAVVSRVLICVVGALFLFPFVWMLATSLKPTNEVFASGTSFLGSRIECTNYAVAWTAIPFGRILINSFLVAFAGALLTVTVSVLSAYAFSRLRFRGRAALFGAFLATMVLPQEVLIIPLYLMIKELNMLDSLWSLILPTAFAAFNFIVMRSFFMALPQELLEAARIDGASDFRILWQIVIPLSKAVIAVIGLFYAVAYWNAFFNAMLYVNDQELWPIQLILRSYVIQGTSMTADQLGVQQTAAPQSIKMAVVVVALVPILLVYPFLQKYFSKGVITGAVKG